MKWVICHNSTKRFSKNCYFICIFLSGKLKPIWVKAFKNRPSKTCGRQALKNFTWPVPEYLDPFVVQYT